MLSRRFHPMLLTACALMAACSTPTEAEQEHQLTVGRFASENPGSVNTLWLEGPDGLVVIDAQRSLPDARRAVDRIRATGEPVVAILITHGHPDHVGGLGVLHDAFPAAPIYASEATDTFMRTDPLGFFDLTREGLGDEYPAQLTYPDRIVDPDETLEVAGLQLETAELGPGEAESTTVYYEPDSGTVFPGDVVDNAMTPALLEGHTCGWLAILTELEDRFPSARTTYPGHGGPGDLDELTDEQRTYLQTVRDLVGPAVATGSPGGATVTAGEQTSIARQLEERYPGYQPVASLPTLVEENIAAVSEELRTERDAPCGE